MKTLIKILFDMFDTRQNAVIAAQNYLELKRMGVNTVKKLSKNDKKHIEKLNKRLENSGG